MNHRYLCQNSRSRRGEPDENVAPVRNALLPSDKAKLFQFVHQTDGRVMLHLQPLAQTSDREATVAGERFQGEERFVLLGRQVRFRGERTFAKAQELAQGVTERSERVVIARMQPGSHAGYNYRNIILLPSRKIELSPDREITYRPPICWHNGCFYFQTMKMNLRSQRTGFTLVEIMIVVAIIALLAAIAVPGFLRARKRSQASRIINDLRLIDSAVDQYAIETNKKSGDAVAVPDWSNYLKKDTVLYVTARDVLGADYGPQTVDAHPQVPTTSKDALSDVTDDTFWSPFN